MNFIEHSYTDDTTGVLFVLHSPRQLTLAQMKKAIRQLAAMKPPRPDDLRAGRAIEYVLTDAPDWFVDEVLREP